MTLKGKDFEALQAKWYKKLAKSGFEDIERDEEYLKERGSTELKTRGLFNPITRETKEEYYRLAGHFLYDFQFETKKDRLIWELHAQGTAIEAIVAIMKSRNFKVYKRLVHETIQKLAKEMGKQCKSRT